MLDPGVFEIVKALIGPVAAVGLAWLVGNRISAHWALRQKRRELSLATTAEFYRLYGAFFAVWKRSNYVFRDSKADLDEATQRELVRQATELEATGEAILLRIASETELGPGDIQTLGLFRQGVQRLRSSIVKRKILGWSSSEHPQYQAFKKLSVAVARLASRVGEGTAPALEKAQAQLCAVTHNNWSKEWESTAPAANAPTGGPDEE